MMIPTMSARSSAAAPTAAAKHSATKRDSRRSRGARRRGAERRACCNRDRRLGLGAIFPASIAEVYLAAIRNLVILEIDVFRHRALNAKLPRPLCDVAQQVAALGERLITTLRAKLLAELSR